MLDRRELVKLAAGAAATAMPRRAGAVAESPATAAATDFPGAEVTVAELDGAMKWRELAAPRPGPSTEPIVPATLTQ